MRKTTLFMVVLFLFTTSVRAAIVDTVTIASAAMQKNIKCVVITPSAPQPGEGWPVVYLLHGYSGNYSNWIMKVPRLKQYADEWKLMIVCPDGDYSSWYFDSPIDPSQKYETYIGKEVPDYIDAHYPVIKNRSGRAITGLSMGGHGGLFLGFRHADRFGACGSMSGGVNLADSRSKYDIMKRIGDTIQYAANWKNYSVIKVIENYPKDSLKIIIDCGNEDQFFAANRYLHQKMLERKIPHDYIERNGKHDWPYWANSVKYQLLFFKSYFDSNRNQ